MARSRACVSGVSRLADGEVGLLDEDWRRPRKGPGSSQSAGGRTRRWRGSLAERGYVAHGYSPVVCRVFRPAACGRREVLHVLRYVLKGADPEVGLEGDGGEQVTEEADLTRVIEDWSPHFSERSNGVDAIHMSWSLPPQAFDDRRTPEAAVAAVRDALADEFGGNWPYYFAAHEDSGKHHVHVVVRTRGNDGRNLPRRKADLQRWRTGFAEAARKHGFQVESSPRYARGVTRQNAADAIYRKQSRGEELEEKSAPTLGESAEWERRIRRRNADERVAYAEAALAVARQARTITEVEERGKQLRLAAQLGLFSQAMPFAPVRSERQRHPVERQEGNALELTAALRDLDGGGRVRIREGTEGRWTSAAEGVLLSSAPAPLVRLDFHGLARAGISIERQGEHVIRAAEAALDEGGQCSAFALQADPLGSWIRVRGVILGSSLDAREIESITDRFRTRMQEQGYAVDAGADKPGRLQSMGALGELVKELQTEAGRLGDEERREVRRMARTLSGELLRAFSAEVDEDALEKMRQGIRATVSKIEDPSSRLRAEEMLQRIEWQRVRERARVAIAREQDPERRGVLERVLNAFEAEISDGDRTRREEREPDVER